MRTRLCSICGEHKDIQEFGYADTYASYDSQLKRTARRPCASCAALHEQGSARCRLCKEVKAHSEFTRRSSGKFRTECRRCRARQEAASRYDTTVGEIDKHRVQQSDRCAICGIHADDIEHAAFEHNPLVIDHHHGTGTIRGLLCPNCNSMIGHANEDPHVLAQAIAYLTR